MWVFLNDAFLSIVAHAEQPDMLLVRARRAGEIEAVFPGAQVAHTPRYDYPYRSMLPRARVAALVMQRLGEIGYPNFKDSVADADRSHAYMQVWWHMREYQRVDKRSRGCDQG